MSPRHILNPALYADRTVQDWHRATFPADHWAIDLDLMGACHICRDPLYLIEATTNPNKPTTILENLARRASTVAYVINHQAGEVVGGQMLFPIRHTTPTREALERQIRSLRAWHMQQAHPQLIWRSA